MKPLVISICLAFIFSATPALPSKPVIGVVKTVKGKVSIQRNGKIVPVKMGDKLFENDTLISGGNESMGVILRDDSLLSIGSNSQVSIDEFIFKPAKRIGSIVVKIKRGTLTYVTGIIAKIKRKSVMFHTPLAMLGVRGTHIGIKVEEK